MQNIRSIHKHELNMLIEIDKIAKKNNIKYHLAYGTALGAVRHKGFIPWDTDVDIMVSIKDYKKLCEVLKSNLNEKYVLRHIKYDQLYDKLLPRVTLKNDYGMIIHVDIFPMVGAPSSRIKKHIFSKVAYLNHRLFFMKKINPNVNYKSKKKKRIVSKLIKVIIYPIRNSIFTKLDNLLLRLFPIEESKEVYNIYGSYGMKEYIPKEWLNKEFITEFEGYELPIPKEYDKYLTHIYGDYMTPKKENYI